MWQLCLFLMDILQGWCFGKCHSSIHDFKLTIVPLYHSDDVNGPVLNVGAEEESEDEEEEEEEEEPEPQSNEPQ